MFSNQSSPDNEIPHVPPYNPQEVFKSFYRNSVSQILENQIFHQMILSIGWYNFTEYQLKAPDGFVLAGDPNESVLCERERILLRTRQMVGVIAAGLLDNLRGLVATEIETEFHDSPEASVFAALLREARIEAYYSKHVTPSDDADGSALD